MAYYTFFELSTKDNKYKVSDIINYMNKRNKGDDCFYPFIYSFEDYEEDVSVTDFQLDADDVFKWYEHNGEMLELSEQFPETVFCLSGKGEESGDLWKSYYKNGKMQYCPARIVFDEFDESKLKGD